MPTAIAAADLPEEITGPYGTARRVPPANFSDNLTGLDTWIITAPRWHPLWTQYMLSVVTLAVAPGVAPATKVSADVTHELLVAALDPSHGPYDADTVSNGSLYLLQPINIAEQVVATDDQARRLTGLCARAVTTGVLCPETGDAPERVRAAWRSSIRQTLEHGDSPEHGNTDGQPRRTS